MPDDILIGDTPVAKSRRKQQKTLRGAWRLWKHSTLADVEGVITRDQMAAMFVVTMVRNPQGRIVSYYHWLRGQGFDHPAVALAKSLNVRDFVNHPQTISSFAAYPYARCAKDAAG